MLKLFDTHTHLNDKKFDLDREEIIKKVKDSGVCCLTNIGANMQTSKESIELSKKYDFIYATVGVHPDDIDKITDDDLLTLKEWAKNEKVVAIGEIGLDYHYETNPRELQQEWFIKQLELAKELNMPVCIHTREAWEDTYNILKEYNLRGIIHCFSGSAEMAEKFINLGYYISFAGPLTYKNSKNAVKSAKIVPNDKVLIETDSPYLPPQKFRGERNDSSYVYYVLEKLAEIKEISVEEMANMTFANAKRIYGLI